MMLPTGFALLASAVAAVAAPTEGSAFTLEAVHPDCAVNGLAVGASISNLWLNLPAQNATCQHPIDEDIATFYLRDTALYLYATKAAPQIIYADRSGMGQGKVGYVTSGQGGPRNAEFDGWAIDDKGNLNIRGAAFVACPSSFIEGSYGLWVSVGVDQPGGNEDCVPVAARAVEEPRPISCHYTQYE